MNLFAVLVTGLLVGGASCAAVQGALLAGLVMRQRRAPMPVFTPGSPSGSIPTAVRGRSGAGRLADDLVPVAGFLTGKLVSHTLLGALLGAAGAAVQLPAGVRAMAQIAAGVLVIVFGLAQPRVPGFGRVVVEPPAAWSTVVRGRARSASGVAPAALGVVSVLLPCGVTLPVEAIALASGSAVAAAAIMAVLVGGTAPLLTALGYPARRAAGAWQSRLTTGTGLLVSAMGVYTGRLTISRVPA